MIRRIFFKVLQESLFHFLILGAGLFAIYSAVNGSVSNSVDRIVVDERQTLHIAEQFHRTWMRPPTRQELQAAETWIVSKS